MERGVGVDVIVKQLREMMDARGWSEYRLAKEASLPQSTVANIFHRSTLPSIPTLKILCDAFGVSLGEFFIDLEQSTLTEEQNILLSKWNRLSQEQKTALKIIIQGMIIS